MIQRVSAEVIQSVSSYIRKVVESLVLLCINPQKSVSAVI